MIALTEKRTLAPSKEARGALTSACLSPLSETARNTFRNELDTVGAKASYRLNGIDKGACVPPFNSGVAV